ncbi:MAG: hypothetical protein LH613_04150 [Chamaesiphon sp.]|nr:hypothetical protein [Chamaesiphon sp.]
MVTVNAKFDRGWMVAQTSFLRKKLSSNLSSENPDYWGKRDRAIRLHSSLNPRAGCSYSRSVDRSLPMVFHEV